MNSELSICPTIETRLRSISNLPSPPRVAMEIIELAQEPYPNLAAVAQTISADPALTTKILRVANSTLYSRRRKSSNLRQALIVLGMNATMTLALSFSLVVSLRQGRKSQLDFEHYWRRNLLAAIAARQLARRFARSDAEDFFMAALLQDIGMLAIDKGFADTYADVRAIQADHARLSQEERSHLGLDHTEIGAWLLESWKMPEALCAAVRWSHDSSAIDHDHEHSALVQSVALSGRLADIWITENGAEWASAVAADAKKLLGIDPAVFGELLSDIRSQMPDAERLYDISLIDGTESELILDQAKEILMIRNLQALNEMSVLRQTAESLEIQTQRLQAESRRDKLTGTYSRAFLEETLEIEFAAAKENDWPLSVLFADLDRFKLINDNYGHLAGDRLLHASAELLMEQTRGSDIVARYGGEEFVVVLPGSDAVAAELVASRIVAAFQRARHDVGDGNDNEVCVTVSIGVATRDPQSPFRTVEALVAAADKAVYAAKVQGRNRFIVHAETDSGATGAKKREPDR